MKRFNIIYFAFIFLLLVSIIYLYINIGQFEEKTKDNIKKVIFNNTSYFIENISSIIKNDINEDLYTTLKKNHKLRNKLEKQMETIVTPSFKYVYMLYRDNNGRYRYLLDGSKDDKGVFDTKFDVNKDEWDKVYDTKKPNVIYQDDIFGLWVTTLSPYIMNGKVVGIIAIDFSTTLFKYMTEIISPLKEIFLYIFVSVLFLFSVIIYQVIAQIRAKKDSIIDPLTHTYNRIFLRDFVTKIDFYNYDIAMFDLDYFKKINDNYGHKAGDYILETFSSIVKKNIRDKDIFIRFGGEEFLLFVYKKKKNRSYAKETIVRIRKSIEDYKFKYESFDIRLTVSVGLVVEIQKYKNIQEIIKKADERLYKAKHSGRNRVVDSDNTINNDTIMVNKLSISQIKQAIDEDRILCQFQPIYRLKSSEIKYYEALVRLCDKSNNLVYPGSFLDSIEGTNIYRDMTKKILAIVFKKIANQGVNISINLNLSDIIDSSIYEMLIKEIRNNQDISKFLTIELLEYEDLDNNLLQYRLSEIKQYGVMISLDDFGSGYSNFSVFESLPIDILKIDGSLIKNIDKSEVSFRIVEAIVLFAHNLNIKVVGEFIHNEEILKIVKSLNIQYGQGFYLGKPIDDIF